METPLVAITLGDPAGVGPEVIAGAWPRPALHACCRPMAVGSPEILRRALALRRVDAEVIEIADPEQAEPSPRVVPCLRAGPPEAADVPPCRIDPRAGQAAYEALLLAAQLALAGRIDAVTTAPLHKLALHQAGHHYPGHTELLADICGVDDFAMMLYLACDERVRAPAGLGVVHVTLHTALRNVFDELSQDAIVAKARLADRVMRALQVARPRIGVCALNPHAGEGGLFGDEEQRLIAPAVQRAAAEGLWIEGPLPADTLLVRASEGEFDTIVAMYHDQGHIALKLLGMHRAVNITLGLPIVRTSVAHGTAFDLAWQGRAEVSSLLEAVRVAALLARARTAAIPGSQGSAGEPSRTAASVE